VIIMIFFLYLRLNLKEEFWLARKMTNHSVIVLKE